MIRPGACVVLGLHSPREKLWGILTSLEPSGVHLRGLDINAFDDWLSAIANGESNIGLTHSFFPMWRVERILLDESLGEIHSMGQLFAKRIGMSVTDYLGFGVEESIS
ncbi:MAG: hypothetical protein ACUVR8_08950 [Acidobacteriota bacterium]